jgi:hypothetical protein
VLVALRAWLDSWRGIGAVERGMAHQGYDLQLTRYDEKAGARRSTRRGWSIRRRARRARPGSPHPWRAVQGAARDALRKANERP